MHASEFCDYIRKLFEDKILLALSAVGALVWKIIFPEQAYIYAAGAVLGIMVLDLLTKIYALANQCGGLKKAIKSRCINSSKFAKGTLDKLIVFGVMLIICGLAYRITPIADLAVWFTQIIFTLMFLRDVLSIIENLTDAGCAGLGIFKKAIEKKMSEYVDEDENKEESKL